MVFASVAVVLVWASTGVFSAVLGLIGLRVTSRGLRQARTARSVGGEQPACQPG